MQAPPSTTTFPFSVGTDFEQGGCETLPHGTTDRSRQEKQSMENYLEYAASKSIPLDNTRLVCCRRQTARLSDNGCVIRCMVTKHKSQITNHKSQITSHKSQITNHKSQITNRLGVGMCRACLVSVLRNHISGAKNLRSRPPTISIDIVIYRR